MGIMETYKLTNSFPDVNVIGCGLDGVAAAVDGAGAGSVDGKVAGLRGVVAGQSTVSYGCAGEDAAGRNGTV